MMLWYLSWCSLWLGTVLSFDTAFICQCSHFFSLMWALALLFLSVLHSFVQFVNVSDQLRAGTAPTWGRGTAEYALHEGGGLPAAYAWEWLTLLRNSPWLWMIVSRWEQWILANQITATGWSHRQWIFFQIIMTIFSKYNQTIVTDYSFNLNDLQLVFVSEKADIIWLILPDSSTDSTGRAQRFPEVSLSSTIKHTWTPYLWWVHEQQLLFQLISSP